MGETCHPQGRNVVEQGAFSILERIDVGETVGSASPPPPATAFSILERIDVGETTSLLKVRMRNGLVFQYPRTDRRG